MSSTASKKKQQNSKALAKKDNDDDLAFLQIMIKQKEVEDIQRKELLSS